MKKLTVFIAALAMVATFAMSAAAAEWNFYGSARVFTFSADIEQAETAPNVQGLTVGGDSSDRDTVWSYTDGRWGAKVKVSDTLSGRVEWSSTNGLRLFYGKWNFGAGSLIVGQHWTPVLNMLISNQVGGSMAINSFDESAGTISLGSPFSSRDAGIQLQFGDFKISLVTPTSSLLGATGEIDLLIPQIEAGYNLTLGKAFVNFAGGYNTYDVECTAANGGDFDVDSYFLAIAGGVNLGMFYVKTSAFIGQNITQYGLTAATDASATVTGATNKVNDNDSLGLVFVAGAKINDMVSFEGGVTYLESELDVTGSNVDDLINFYVQATVNLAPGVFIVPEIGYIDHKDGDVKGVDEGNITYFGLKWQINF
jgi:hypothetical protein